MNDPIPVTEEFTQLNTDRLGVVEQAIEVAAMMPDCPARAHLLEVTAAALAAALSITACITTEEPEATPDPLASLRKKP
jgi:hypothetical protein